jgi:NADH dehydrogenase
VAEERKRVLIVGGGFAGATLARSLGRRLPDGWEVILFSAENYFIFTPLLSEVVASAIDPQHVVWSVREVARRVTCRTVTVRSLDLEKQEVVYARPGGSELREHWDHLVLACGLAVNLDLVPGMAQNAWPLKTLGDALALRNRLVQQLEKAEAEPDPARRTRLLSVAVVGGGFTGVELAGSIMDLWVDASRYYRNFTPEDLHVRIVDAGPRILGPLPESLSKYATRHLQAHHVEVLTGRSVKEVRSEGVVTGEGDGEGELVEADTTIVAVGNTVQPLLADTALPMERGRLVVGQDMRVPGRSDVWALGDCAAVPNAFDGGPSPTLAQFAIRQAVQLRENLLAVLSGRETKPFHHRMQGMFAAIGHRRAVGNPFGLRISGFPAYVLWRAIYWAKMPTLLRRIQIAIDWTLDLLFPRDIVELSTLRTGRPVDVRDEVEGAGPQG